MCKGFLKVVFGAWLIYNVVVVSAGQQSESAIFMHIQIPTLLSVYSHVGYYRVLGGVPCPVGGLISSLIQ